MVGRKATSSNRPKKRKVTEEPFDNVSTSTEETTPEAQHKKRKTTQEPDDNISTPDENATLRIQQQVPEVTHEPDSDVSGTDTAIERYTDKTAQNALQSSLLRLPAELRNMIWTFAYGNGLIEEDRVAYCGPKKPSLVYAESLGAPGLVSKQYWAEAWSVFLETCTFKFDTGDNWCSFLASGSPVVGKIRRLSLRVWLTEQPVSCFWVVLDELSPSQVEKLKCLEGLKLEGDYCLHTWQGAPTGMDDPKLEKAGVLKLIRIFQQFKLKRELTQVNFKVEGCGHKLGRWHYHMAKARASKLNREILERLLDRSKAIEELRFRRSILGNPNSHETRKE